MGMFVPRQACYLVEWYDPLLTDERLELTAARLDECVASMNADGSSVQLLMTLAVPTDEVVFGVFAASSEQVVAEACKRAGTPAQRLTIASRLGPA